MRARRQMRRGSGAWGKALLLALPGLWPWLAPGVAAAEEAPDVLGLPAYPFTASTRIPVDMQTNGVPQKTLVTFTDDSVRTVLRYYRESLQPRGAPILEHAYSTESAYIGYHDPQAQVTRLVSAMAQADGRTLLIFSAMDARGLIQGEVAVPDDLPGLPEASQVTSTDEAYGGTRYRTVHFLVAGLSPATVQERLVAAAQAQGWRPGAAEDNPTGLQLHLSKGRATCMIQVGTASAPDTGDPVTSVTLMALEPRQAP